MANIKKFISKKNESLSNNEAINQVDAPTWLQQKRKLSSLNS